MRRAAIPTLAACLLVGGTATGSAQTLLPRDVPRRGTIEVSGAGMWLQGFALEPSTAELSRAVESQRFDLFTTETDVQAAGGLRARLGVFLTRSISLEGGVGYSRPTLAIGITGDAEMADDAVATERLSHYVIDGAVLFHIRPAAFGGGRGLPFFALGGGHLRELHDGNELLETGTVLHVSGGVKYWFGAGDRRLGLRAEAGVTSRDGGADDGGDSRRLVPMVLGGVSVLF